MAHIGRPVAGRNQFAHQFVAFRNEQALLAAVFLVLKRVDEFYACLAQHFSLLKLV